MLDFNEVKLRSNDVCLFGTEIHGRRCPIIERLMLTPLTVSVFAGSHGTSPTPLPASGNLGSVSS